jgi:hypothetical protein
MGGGKLTFLITQRRILPKTKGNAMPSSWLISSVAWHTQKACAQKELLGGCERQGTLQDHKRSAQTREASSKERSKSFQTGKELPIGMEPLNSLAIVDAAMRTLKDMLGKEMVCENSESWAQGLQQ